MQCTTVLLDSDVIGALPPGPQEEARHRFPSPVPGSLGSDLGSIPSYCVALGKKLNFSGFPFPCDQESCVQVPRSL